MSKYLPLLGLCVVFSLFICLGSLSAQDDNPGAALLDQATEEKLKASSVDDMAKVIALCLQAKKEGLSGENLNYCNQLLASTQLQRGLFNAGRLLKVAGAQTAPDWPATRKVALDDLENAVRVLTDQPLPFLLIAQLNLLPDGDAKRAAEALEQAEAKAKDNRELLVEIIKFKLLLENDPVKREELLAKAVETNSDAQLLLLHAMSLLDLKKTDVAIDILKKIVDKEPENAGALAMLIDPLRDTERYEDALKVIDALEKIAGDRPKEKLVIEKAKTFARMGKTEDAVKLLADLREKNPNDPTILFVRAGIHQMAKDFDNALKDIDAALRILPENVLFHGLKAEILLDKGDIADARKIAEELFKENEGDLLISRLYIRILDGDKDYDKAVEVIDKIMEVNAEQIDPKKTSLMKIHYLSRAKKSRQALDELEVLFEKDQENVDYLRNKGMLLLAVNRHSDAVKAYDAALKAEPDDEMSLNNLSWVLSTSPSDMVRNGQRALELAEKACKLTEYKKAYILSTLAAAYAELGDFEKALEWSKKCIEIAENDPEDKERLDDLKKELESYKKKQPYRESMEEP